MNSAQALLEKYKVEINRHNFDTVAPLISKDCKFWFSSGTFVGLEQTRQAFEKTWAMIKEEVYTLTDIEWIADSDQAAVCTYTFNWKGLIEGKPLEGKGRGTSCFRKEADGWKIVHEHLSHPDRWISRVNLVEKNNFRKMKKGYVSHVQFSAREAQSRPKFDCISSHDEWTYRRSAHRQVRANGF